MQKTVSSIGIDVSKIILEVAFLLSDKSIVRTREENTITGIEKILLFFKRQETA